MFINCTQSASASLRPPTTAPPVRIDSISAGTLAKPMQVDDKGFSSAWRIGAPNSFGD
jgi:hypothetical protein